MINVLASIGVLFLVFLIGVVVGVVLTCIEFMMGEEE